MLLGPNCRPDVHLFIEIADCRHSRWNRTPSAENEGPETICRHSSLGCYSFSRRPSMPSSFSPPRLHRVTNFLLGFRRHHRFFGVAFSGTVASLPVSDRMPPGGTAPLFAAGSLNSLLLLASSTLADLPRQAEAASQNRCSGSQIRCNRELTWVISIKVKT
jgi:hypothetical protein